MAENKKGTGKKRSSKTPAIDPIDAAAAICDLQILYRKKGLSLHDLASELDWPEKRVYEFFTGTEFPSRQEFQSMAEALNYTLDF